MRVNFQKEKIVTLNIRLELGDPLYHKCESADLTLNLDKWRMDAHTDIGSFSYRWAPEQKRNFLDFLIGLKNDGQYLLSKISNRTEFSLNETKYLILDLYEDEMTKAQKEWVKGAQAYDGQEFITNMRNSGLFNDWRDLWELPQYDYPQNAKNFVELFSTVIADALTDYKKSLENVREDDREEENELI